MTRKSAGAHAANEAEVSTVTTTAYQLLAAEIIETFQSGASRIPGWADEFPVTTATGRRVASREMVAKAVAAALAIPELLAMDPGFPEQTLETTQYAEAFLPMITELRSITRRLEQILRVRDTKASRGALRMYKALQHMFPELKHRELAKIHLETLRKEYQRWKRSSGKRTVTAQERLP